MPMHLKRLLAKHRLMNAAGEGDGGSGSGQPAGEQAPAAGEGAPEGGEGEKDDKSGQGTRISDADAKLLKENMAKKKALQEANDALTAARAELAKFQGIDAEKARQLLEEQRTAEERQLEAKGEWDRLKARMAQEHNDSIQAQNAELQRLRQESEARAREIDELTIGQQFNTSPFIANQMTLPPTKARIVFGEHFDREDGQVVAYDKPRGDSTRTKLVDQYGVALGFEAALEKLVKADADADSLLRSHVKPGAGSESRQANKLPSTRKEELSGQQKIEAGVAGLFK